MSKQNIISSALIAAAMGVLVAIYFLPVWWVSLTAPNYPEEAFPDGVKILFHMNGVFNGCEKVEKDEITEDEALDCVHEMDTINHYVGMYPIASGGVVEKAFSQFLVALMVVMLLGFLCMRPKIRMAIMSVAFVGISVWMYMTWYTAGGLSYQNAGYVSALVTSLDQDTEKDTPVVELDAGAALIARLQDSLNKSNKVEPVEQWDEVEKSDKQINIDHLHVTFNKDQERKPPEERMEWNGSGSQMMSWHYEKSLGKYFNNPAEIKPMVSTMTMVANFLFWAIVAAMILLVYGARKSKGILYWLLILVPMALPLFFLIEYSAWLWWYGHTLNAMGAFTVKPFMPTVFGQGKVAQFSTHSYPAIGFGLMMLMSFVLAVAALLRRKSERGQQAS